MEFFLFIIACLAGGWFARMDGGAPPKVNEWFERALCMSFFVFAAWNITGNWWTLVSLLGTFGIATGHGTYFLNRMVKAASTERTDFIVRLFFGRDPRTWEGFAHLRGSNWKNATDEDINRIGQSMHQYGMTKLYWRNVFGMFVTGTMVGLPTGILAIVYGQYLAAIPLFMTGFAKAIGYMIGYWMEQNNILKRVSKWKIGKLEIGKHLDHDTAIGEYLNGVIRTALALISKG